MPAGNDAKLLNGRLRYTSRVDLLSQWSYLPLPLLAVQKKADISAFSVLVLTPGTLDESSFSLRQMFQAQSTLSDASTSSSIGRKMPVIISIIIWSQSRFYLNLSGSLSASLFTSFSQALHLIDLPLLSLPRVFCRLVLTN